MKSRKKWRPDHPIRSLFFALFVASAPLAGPAAAEIVNSAVASGVHDTAIVQSGGAQATVGVEPAQPGLSVAIESSMSGNSTLGLPDGDTVDYSIVIENTGDVGLVGVRLTLELQQGEETFAPSDAPRYEGGDFADPGVLNRGETWRFAASYGLQRSNVEAGGSIIAKLAATGRAASKTVSDIRELATAVPQLQGIDRRHVSLAHTPSAIDAGVGDQVDYTITISNRSAKPLSVRLRAALADGIALVPGSVLQAGAVADVSIDGQRVDFGGIDIAPRNNVSLRYLGEITEAAERGYHVNTAQIADTETLIPLLSPSLATVRTGAAPLDGCAELSLLVFEDENRNGFADPGERGVSGARVAAGADIMLTTDMEGQFATPCMQVSRLGEIGLIFELDEGTLLEGYHPTVPNPLSIRVEPGGNGAVSFGVASARILRVDLNAAAFRRNEATPDEELADGILQLISVLRREPSALRLTYYAHRERVDLPEERLENVRQSILDRWAAAGGAYDLEIETRVVRNGG